MTYLLPHSFMIFIVSALCVAGAIFVRRKKFPARPDFHMRFIYAGAVLPLVSAFISTYFSNREMMKFVKEIPIWIVYWTLFDIVYHFAQKKKPVGYVASVALCLLFAFGVFERMHG